MFTFRPASFTRQRDAGRHGHCRMVRNAIRVLRLPAASRQHRPAAGTDHAADGARPHARFLRRRRHEPARHRRPRAVPDAVGHAFLRAGLHFPRRPFRLALRQPGTKPQRTEPVPSDPRILAHADRAHVGALRLELQPGTWFFRHPSHLGDRSLDGRAGGTGSFAALRDHHHRTADDRRTQSARRRPRRATWCCRMALEFAASARDCCTSAHRPGSLPSIR